MIDLSRSLITIRRSSAPKVTDSVDRRGEYAMLVPLTLQSPTVSSTSNSSSSSCGSLMLEQKQAIQADSATSTTAASATAIAQDILPREELQQPQEPKAPLSPRVTKVQQPTEALPTALPEAAKEQVPVEETPALLSLEIKVEAEETVTAEIRSTPETQPTPKYLTAAQAEKLQTLAGKITELGKYTGLAGITPNECIYIGQQLKNISHIINQIGIEENNSPEAIEKQKVAQQFADARAQEKNAKEHFMTSLYPAIQQLSEQIKNNKPTPEQLDQIGQQYDKLAAEMDKISGSMGFYKEHVERKKEVAIDNPWTEKQKEYNIRRIAKNAYLPPLVTLNRNDEIEQQENKKILENWDILATKWPAARTDMTSIENWLQDKVREAEMAREAEALRKQQQEATDKFTQSLNPAIQELHKKTIAKNKAFEQKELAEMTQECCRLSTEMAKITALIQADDKKIAEKKLLSAQAWLLAKKGDIKEALYTGAAAIDEVYNQEAATATGKAMDAVKAAKTKAEEIANEIRTVRLGHNKLGDKINWDSVEEDYKYFKGKYQAIYAPVNIFFQREMPHIRKEFFEWQALTNAQVPDLHQLQKWLTSTIAERRDQALSDLETELQNSSSAWESFKLEYDVFAYMEHLKRPLTKDEAEGKMKMGIFGIRISTTFVGETVHTWQSEKKCVSPFDPEAKIPESLAPLVPETRAEVLERMHNPVELKNIQKKAAEDTELVKIMRTD